MSAAGERWDRYFNSEDCVAWYALPMMAAAPASMVYVFSRLAAKDDQKQQTLLNQIQSTTTDLTHESASLQSTTQRSGIKTPGGKLAIQELSSSIAANQQQLNSLETQEAHPLSAGHMMAEFGITMGTLAVSAVATVALVYATQRMISRALHHAPRLIH